MHTKKEEYNSNSLKRKRNKSIDVNSNSKSATPAHEVLDDARRRCTKSMKALINRPESSSTGLPIESKQSHHIMWTRIACGQIQVYSLTEVRDGTAVVLPTCLQTTTQQIDRALAGQRAPMAPREPRGEREEMIRRSERQYQIHDFPSLRLHQTLNPIPRSRNPNRSLPFCV